MRVGDSRSRTGALLPEKEHVLRTRADPRGHMEDLDTEAEVLEAMRVPRVRARRPDPDDSSRPERRVARSRPRVAVEPLVRRLRKRHRTVVDVEEDHVERPW